MYDKRVLNTGLTRLPPHKRRHGAVDDLCCCPYCSADGHAAPARMGAVWDTLATDLTTGDTWLCHAPEVYGVRPRRPLRSSRPLRPRGDA